jgi:hypothetical protein
MTLYQILNQLEEFFVSMRRLETHISLDVKFPSNWSMPKSTTQEFQIVPFEYKEEGWRGMSFVCEFNDKEVEKNLGMITKVIKLNREREQKEKLFQTVVSELKKTFEKSELEKLQNLSFIFNQPENLNTENGLQGETIGLAE